MRSLIIFITILSLSIFQLTAQITITSTDMPDIGDSVRLSRALTTGNVDFTLTGTNYNWDFSSLIPVSQDVDTFFSVISTPLTYYPSFLLYSSYAKKGEDFSLINLNLTDVYDYYKETSSEYRYIGWAATLNGIPVPARYDNYDIIYNFPLNYGDIDSCLANYDIQIPFLGYFGNNKKRVNHVDGWGTLTTPYGTFQTLRVRSEITATDSIYIDSLGINFPSTTNNYTEYKWLANGFPAPLLTVIDRLIVDEILYIDSARTLWQTTQFDELKELTVDISPNPVNNIINLRFSKNNLRYAQIDICDMRGYKLFSRQYSQFYDHIQIILYDDTIPSGLYLINISGEGFLITKKIILQ